MVAIGHRTNRLARLGFARPRVGLVAVALLVASPVLGVLANVYPTFPLDERLTPFGRDIPVFASAAQAITEHELAVVGSAIALLAGAVALRRRWELATFAALVLGLRYALEAPKALVNRPRPDGDFAVFDVATNSSFPSGHVMTAVAVFGLWFVLAPALLQRRLVLPARMLAVLLIALTMSARMWAGVHWFSDTVGGVVWASAALAVAIALLPASSSPSPSVRAEPVEAPAARTLIR